MKHKEFNKLGDTSYRVEKQVNGWWQFFVWVVSNKDSLRGLDDASKDKMFKTWCKDEQIYNYPTNDKQNRFKLLISSLEKWKFISKDFEPQIDIDSSNSEPFESIFFRTLYNNYSPFKKGIDFILNSKDIEIKFINFYLAFIVFEEGDSFESLYQKDTDEIIDLIAKKSLDNINIDSYINTLNFRKPPKFLSLYKNIFLKIQRKEEIVFEDFLSYKSDFSDEKYFKHLIKDKKIKTFEQKINFIIPLLNNIEGETQFIYFFEKLRVMELLFNDYRDLFARWMFDFHLIKSKQKQDTFTCLIDKSRISFVQNKICLNYESDVQYPYTLQQCREYLKQINQQDVNNRFSFKNNDENLKNVANSTLAEYFVNLYFCHIKKIRPIDAFNIIKTKMDIYLYPSSHAPGGTSDLVYIDEELNTIYCIESTIHTQATSTSKYEVEPITRHIFSELGKQNNENNKPYNAKLIFVTYNNNDMWINLCIKGILNGIMLHYENIIDRKIKVDHLINNFEEYSNITAF